MDESGFMLQPVVRRTWAPRGHTPIQHQWDRHDRLSVACALTLSPQRRRRRLYFNIQTTNIRGPDMVAFLRQLRRHVRGKLVLIWDRWSVHRSALVRKYCEKHARRIRVEWLPSYAPELNPVEQVWSHTKYGELANFAPHDIDHLDDAVRRSIRSKRRNQALLLSFVRHTGLRL